MTLSLTKKIGLLVGLPIVILSLGAVGLALFGGRQATQQLRTMEAQAGAVLATSREAADIMADVKNAALAAYDFLLRKQAAALNGNVAALTGAETALAELTRRVGDLASLPERLAPAIAEAEGAGNTVLAGELRYVARTATTAGTLLELATTSGAHTAELLRGKRPTLAANNFKFEERARIGGLVARLQKTASLTSSAAAKIAATAQSELAAITAGASRSNEALTWWTTLATLAIALGAIVVALMTTRTLVTHPLREVTEALGRLADGDLSVSVNIERTDDIGALAATLGSFRQSLLRAAEVEDAAARERTEQAEAARHSRATMAADFDSSVRAELDHVVEATRSMESTAARLTDASDRTARRAATTGEDTAEASANVQTVASAAEELSASIAEIASQVQRQSQSAAAATQRSAAGQDEIRKLVEEVTEIDTVVALITEIADRTNMLALNATIEAARAGEAGKGFAVVAAEVKALADQTAQSTKQITDQIGAVRHSTDAATRTMDEIVAEIGKISEISTAVAAAIEEQNAATSEISNNIAAAATRTMSVNSGVVDLSQAANDAGEAANTVRTAVDDLGQRTDSLMKLFGKFVREAAA